MMNYRLAFWYILSCSLILVRDGAVAKAEECYVSNIDTGEDKIMCFDVKDNGIIVYDEALHNNLTQILLFRTELSIVNSIFFEKLAATTGKIEMLTMSHGNLSKIEEHSFGRFKGLQHLNLSFNKIGDVSEKAFAENTNLKSISLMSNEIEQLKVDTFSTLVDLESIDLTRNRLDTLDKHLFLDNVNLVNLDVKFNNLKEISGVMFHALPALECLDLSHNQIEIIPPHVFKYNYALKKLNLQGNKIQFVDFAFVHLGLSELNLLENPLDMSNEKNQRAIKHLRMSDVVMLKVANHNDYEEDKEEGTNRTAGEVILKTSPQLKLMLVGIIASLVIIMVLLSFLLYHVHQKRSKQKLYKRYYYNSCSSTEHLQGDEQKCLALSISEESAFFHNCQAASVHSNEEGCSAVSCFKKNIDQNINA